MSNLFDSVKVIHFVDVGCSGELDPKWTPLLGRLAFTGFDPNAAECERLGREATSFQSCRFLPFAIAGRSGEQTLHKTSSIYCYSLLQPNHPWLDRFTFGHLFAEVGTESVACTTLDELAAQHGLRADVLKLDTQGLELPILQSGGRVLEGAFCVETETGFVPNYVGETVFGDIDPFMRSRGYLLFDINSNHPIARKNALAKHGKHQPLWCEALWLFDYVGRQKVPTREQALASLLICRTLEYFDFGLELASYFREVGRVEPHELEWLQEPTNWTQTA